MAQAWIPYMCQMNSRALFLHNGSGWEKKKIWFDGLGQVKGLFPSLGIVKLWF